MPKRLGDVQDECGGWHTRKLKPFTNFMAERSMVWMALGISQPASTISRMTGDISTCQRLW